MMPEEPMFCPACNSVCQELQGTCREGDAVNCPTPCEACDRIFDLCRGKPCHRCHVVFCRRCARHTSRGWRCYRCLAPKERDEKEAT
jgi:hypothetical protein